VPKVKRTKKQQPPTRQDIFQKPAFWLGSGGLLLVLIVLLAIVANRSGASAPDVAAVSGRFAELGAVGRTVGPEDGTGRRGAYRWSRRRTRENNRI